MCCETDTYKIKYSFMNTTCKIWWLLYLLSFYSNMGFGQQVKFDDPRMAKFTIFGDTPVSHSTGIPDISIPLFNLTSHGYELPVTLRYHPSLVKAPFDQTNIATGWVLEVGGNITQQTKGINDLHDKRPGQWKTSEDLYDQWDPEVQGFLENVLVKKVDTQYDIFSFSILGKNGEFILAKNSASVFELNFLSDPLFKGSLIGYNPIEVPSPGFNLESIDILDDSGYRYVFPEKFKDQIGLNSDIVTRHLEKIIDPLGNQLFIFDYQSITYTSPSEYPFSARVTINTDPTFDWRSGDPDCGDVMPGAPINSLFRQFDGDYISKAVKKITFDSGYLEFYFSSDNSHITEVKLFDNSGSGHYIKRYVFDYGLFPGAGYRYLDKVIATDKSGVSEGVYEFEYFEGESANIESSTIHTDYWGYLNGINFNPNGFIDLGAKTVSNVKTCLNQLVNFNLGSGSKDPTLNYAKTFTLNAINYPTGGRTVFDFELNELSGKKYGGLRIKGMTDYDSDDTVVKRKRFEYNSGTLNINYVADQPLQASLVLIDVPFGNFDSRPFGHYFQKTYDDNFYTNFGVNTPRYTSVTEYLEDSAEDDIGKTEYYYDFLNQNIVQSLVDRRDFSFFDNEVYANNSIEFHHNYIDEYRGWGNGLLRRKINYKKTGSGYQEVYEEEYIYKHHVDKTFNNLAVYNLLSHKSFSGGWLYGYYWFREDFIQRKYADGSYIWTKYSAPYPDPVAPYDSFIKKGAFKLEKKITKATSEIGILETVEVQHYDNGLMQQASRITRVNSKGETAVMHYTYPSNATVNTTGMSSGTINTMKANNVLAPILKEEEYIDGRHASGRISFYNVDTHGNLVVDKVRNFNQVLDDYETKQLYKYDLEGNLIMLSKVDGASTSYFWGYNKKYPVAMAENAADTEIAYTSFETTEKGGWSYNGTPVASNYITGKKGYHLGTGPVTKTGIAASATNPYRVGFWAKRLYGSGSVNVGGQTESLVTNVWKWVEKDITSTSLTISGSSVVIDELRLHPADAMMTSYTYEPLVGMTSKTDARGYTLTYFYDSANRLKTIRDEDDNVLETYEYNYITGENLP